MPAPAAVSIRRARLDEVERLVAVVNGSYRGDGNWTHEQGLVAGPRVTHADVAALLQAMHAERPGGAPPPSIVLVAETEEHPELIGCIEVTTTDAALAAGGTTRDGYLGMLAVDARFGSRGVGRALVAAGEDAARSVYNATGVVLYVLAIRADILAWYGRRGYAPTGLRADARSLIEGIHSDAKLLADSDFVIVRRAL